MSNKSTNKIRVTRLFGNLKAVGLADPAVNFRVRFENETRWIVSMTNRNALLNLALSSGGPVVAQAYPHQCSISSGVLNTTHGRVWPSGTGDVAFGRRSVFSNGVPTAAHSGMVSTMGRNPTVFFR